MQNITITYNGLTLGDGSNYYISYLDTGDIEVRQADQLASGRDGGFIFNQNYGMRNITIEGNIFSNSGSQLFDDIAALRTAFARTNTAHELVINYWDGTVRRIDCFPVILPNPAHSAGDVDKSKFNIRLIAPYPYFKGATSETVTTTLNLSNTLGFDYPVTYPFSYQPGNSTFQYTWNNDGDTTGFIKVVFNGSVINPTLTNSTNGKYVQIEKTLSTSDYVTLEYTNTGRNIVNQLGVNYETYFNGETAFFFVPVGSNTFSFTASTYDALANCTITLDKYYLS